MTTEIARQLPPGPAGFDYSLVPAADRDWLAAATARIRDVADRAVRDMIRVGELLAEVRARLGYGSFEAWIRAEFPWSKGHAYRLIGIAEAFGPHLKSSPAETSAGFERHALYLLARPEVPAGARNYAIELARIVRVTLPVARSILARAGRQAAASSPPDPEEDELPDDDEPPEGEPVRPDLAAGGRLGVGQEAAGDAEAASLGYAVMELFEKAHSFHAVVILDEDDEPLYSLTVYSDDVKPRNFVRRRKADAFLAALGREPTRWCRGCWQELAASLFCDNAGSPDGRNPVCKKCERKRLAELKKQKREGRPRPT